MFGSAILLMLLFQNILFAKTKEEPYYFKRSILEHQSFYSDGNNFKNVFIDFNEFTVYQINKNKYLIDKENTSTHFTWNWRVKNDEPEIFVICEEPNCKYSKIDLKNQNYIKFDFDYLFFNDGAIIAYIFILYGIFNLKRGYIFYNCSAFFFAIMTFILSIREISELLKIKNYLRTDDDKSIKFSNTIFIMTPIISILYGFVCHYSSILKYITFGILDGLILSKIFFYFILMNIINLINDAKFYTSYVINEVIFIIAFVILLLILKSKYDNFTIINFNVFGGYGIILGINMLIGGLPFIPYFIVVKEYGDKDTLSKLAQRNNIIIYSLLYLFLIGFGFYLNKFRNISLRMKLIKNKISKN